MSKRRVKVSYRKSDGGSIPDLPDLEACSAFGRTPAEALQQAQIAKRA